MAGRDSGAQPTRRVPLDWPSTLRLHGPGRSDVAQRRGQVSAHVERLHRSRRAISPIERPCARRAASSWAATGPEGVRGESLGFARSSPAFTRSRMMSRSSWPWRR